MSIYEKYFYFHGIYKVHQIRLEGKILKYEYEFLYLSMKIFFSWDLSGSPTRLKGKMLKFKSDQNCKER